MFRGIPPGGMEKNEGRKEKGSDNTAH